MRRICDYIKAHSYGLLVFAITITVASFIGVLVARMINIAETESAEITHDTIHMKPSMTDSLLQDISMQVRDINSKIQVRKPSRKRKAKNNDTIKMDATIHLDQNGANVGE